MKKLVISIFFLLMFLTSVKSTYAIGTGVSGVISTDTVWTVKNSPYYVQGNIQIKDANLSIEPGVKVFGNGFRIDLANGSFNSLGIKENPVYIEKMRLYAPVSSVAKAEINLNYTQLKNGALAIAPTKFNSIGSTFNNLTTNINLIAAKSDTRFNYNTVKLGNFQIMDFSNDVKTYIGHNLFYTGFGGGNNSIRYSGNKITTSVPDLNINYNTILSGNNKTFITTTSIRPIKAVNNYWNTVNEDTIKIKINNKNNVVNYMPYLTTPHRSTPSLNVLTLSETTPVTRKIGVELNSSVTFRFNREIVKGIGYEAIRFQTRRGLAVEFSKRIEGDKLILTPIKPLNPNTEYMVMIEKNTVQATDGTKIIEEGQHLITFRTNFE